MANKLTVIFSGKKESGRNSASQFVFSEFLNRKIGKARFALEKVGKDVLVIDTFKGDHTVPTNFPNPTATHIADTYSVKVYSFSDPVRQFCIDSLGLDSAQCYGSDDDRNSVTHISWDDFFDQIREKYSRPRRGTGGNKPASGFMTAREVMDVVENEIFRRLDSNCWARSLYSLIQREGHELAIINDASRPNEVTMGSESGAKAIRLLRNVSKENDTVLDELPLGEYDLVVDNQNMTMGETHTKIKKHVQEWFGQKRLV